MAPARIEAVIGMWPAAVDAQAAKDSSQFGKLRTAAGHMPMTASILAGAIVKQFPDKFEG